MWPSLRVSSPTESAHYVCRAYPNRVEATFSVLDDGHCTDQVTFLLGQGDAFAGDDVWQDLGLWLAQRLALHDAVRRSHEEHEAWSRNVQLDLRMEWGWAGLDDVPFINAATRDPNTFLLAATGADAERSLPSALVLGTLRYCCGASCQAVQDFSCDDFDKTLTVGVRYEVPLPAPCALRVAVLQQGDSMKAFELAAADRAPCLDWAGHFIKEFSEGGPRQLRDAALALPDEPERKPGPGRARWMTLRGGSL